MIFSNAIKSFYILRAGKTGQRPQPQGNAVTVNIGGVAAQPHRAGHPQVKKGNSNTSIENPNPHTSPVTLLGMVWWPKYNPVLKLQEAEMGKDEEQPLCRCSAHQVLRKRQTQTPCFMTDLCLLLFLQVCSMQAWSESPDTTCQNSLQDSSHPISPSQHKPLDIHSSAYILVKQHESRLASSLLEGLTSQETTHAAPRGVLLLIKRNMKL